MIAAHTLLDRLLGHDADTTRTLLRIAERLDDSALDEEFDLGLGTVRETLHHIVRVMECWTDLLAESLTSGPLHPGEGIRPRLDARAPLAELSDRLDAVAADLRQLAHQLVTTGKVDANYVDHYDDPPKEKSYGGTLIHIATHGMHHRAQLLHMLAELGVDDLPEGDALGWESARARPEISARPTPPLDEADLNGPPRVPPTVRALTATDRSDWLRMRVSLWPDVTRIDQEAEIDAYLGGDRRIADTVFLAEGSGGAPVGFLELRLRGEAEGCATSPVPYVEGWFVAAHERGHGVGRALIGAAEAWSRSRGYTELASDAEIENEESVAAHRALGFEEVARHVALRKRL